MLFIALAFAIINNLVMIGLGSVQNLLMIVLMVLTYIVGYGMYNMYNFLTPELYADPETATIVSTKCVAAMNCGGMILTPVMAQVIETFGFDALWSLIAGLNFVAVFCFAIMFFCHRKQRI